MNGRWLVDHDMPADRATDGAFRLLADRAEEQVRDLITEAAATQAPSGTDQRRIGDLYASFMDTDAIARIGVRPLLDELAEVDAAADPDARYTAAGDLLFAAVNVARKLKVDPELALRSSADRFRARVEAAERLAEADGARWNDLQTGRQITYYAQARLQEED